MTLHAPPFSVYKPVFVASTYVAHFFPTICNSIYLSLLSAIPLQLYHNISPHSTHNSPHLLLIRCKCQPPLPHPHTHHRTLRTLSPEAEIIHIHICLDTPYPTSLLRPPIVDLAGQIHQVTVHHRACTSPLRTRHQQHHITSEFLRIPYPQ